MSKKNRDKTICPICGVDHAEAEFEPDFDDCGFDVVTSAGLTEEVIVTWLRLRSGLSFVGGVDATLALAWEIVSAANGY